MKRRILRVALVAAVAVSLCTAVARADVTPPEVSVELAPGESTTVTKTVTIPEVASKLDLFLIVDLSGSYDDDVGTIQGLAPDLFDDVRAEASDSEFGLGTFVDFPFSPWGDESYGDYAYRLDQDLTSDRTTWLDAVDAMATKSGNDGPESQYEALYQAATGDGREMPPTTDGDYSDLGEIAPGLDPSWRADANKVIAITTDASFHDAGDSGSSFAYPGASRDDTVNALNAANIKVIALKASGAGSEMDDIASATGGIVKTTDASSSEIAEAILEGLAELEFDVTATPVDCDPLEITFEPNMHSDVPGGSSVDFDETIAVPSGVTAADVPSGVVQCTVEFRAGDAVVGTQDVRVELPWEEPPDIPEASTLLLLGSAVSGLAGYVGLQLRARRRRQ